MSDPINIQVYICGTEAKKSAIKLFKSNSIDNSLVKEFMIDFSNKVMKFIKIFYF